MSTMRLLCFVFRLWSLTGRLVGYQQYRPFAPKHTAPDHRKQARYFTYVSKEHMATSLAAFGVEQLDLKQRVLFLAEGVFDVVPLHRLGVNALAVLGNNPKHLKEWLNTLPFHVVALCDGDEAGQTLARFAHQTVSLPSGKDPGDMSDEWFKSMLSDFGYRF
ncbi:MULTISPECIES: toprim domain-containing protein [Vibrio]|uniref:toprim domain-containing protein n=1 Tax=Vibrio TaxID=662 RepID=UPI000C83F0C3|nr:toprim domain-containing protein [Vibrio lentus]